MEKIFENNPLQINKWWLFCLAIKPRHPIHLEIQRRDTTPVGILRTTFRDPVSGQLRHTTHGRLTGLTLDVLLLIQAAIHGEVMLKSDPEALPAL